MGFINKCEKIKVLITMLTVSVYLSYGLISDQISCFAR